MAGHRGGTENFQKLKGKDLTVVLHGRKDAVICRKRTYAGYLP